MPTVRDTFLVSSIPVLISIHKGRARLLNRQLDQMNEYLDTHSQKLQETANSQHDKIKALQQVRHRALELALYHLGGPAAVVLSFIFNRTMY